MEAALPMERPLWGELQEVYGHRNVSGFLTLRSASHPQHYQHALSPTPMIPQLGPIVNVV